MKPVGKYANDVIINLADRKALMQELKDSKAKLDGIETEEEKAAREERQRQRLYILDQLREAMSKAYAVLGANDGQFAIFLANDDIRKHRKFIAANEVGSEEF